MSAKFGNYVVILWCRNAFGRFRLSWRGICWSRMPQGDGWRLTLGFVTVGWNAP